MKANGKTTYLKEKASIQTKLVMSTRGASKEVSIMAKGQCSILMRISMRVNGSLAKRKAKGSIHSQMGTTMTEHGSRIKQKAKVLP